MKVKFGNVEYNVKALPLNLMPYNDLYANLVERKVTSVDDAEKIGNELVVIRSKILGACVTPQPLPEHESRLHIVVNNLTIKESKEAESFFLDKRANPKKRDGIGADFK